jgi:glutamate formiminotransferase/formiminotetrahydrofolate cyclodeaminase
VPDGDALVECVPNVSEGRDAAVLAVLADAICGVPGVRLLHVDAGVDANRTVFTFVGPPEPVGDAAVRLAHAVARTIDMRSQSGAHPRLGALDVCPFVPVRATTLARCAGLARRVASTLAHDLDLPVYLYEAAAFDPDRRGLPALRAGEYEGLAARIGTRGSTPDFGPSRLHPGLGAAIVGARSYLVAWNVALSTDDVDVATRIAARVRTSGYVRVAPDGTRVRVPGVLPAVRAVGWGMPSYGHAQVSLNLLDVGVTPMHVAYDAVAREAAREGHRVIGSELVGLVPLNALRDAGRDALGAAAFDAADEALVAAAVARLGLDAVHAFEPRTRVIEYALDAGTRTPST